MKCSASVRERHLGSGGINRQVEGVTRSELALLLQVCVLLPQRVNLVGRNPGALRGLVTKGRRTANDDRHREEHAAKRASRTARVA